MEASNKTSSVLGSSLFCVTVDSGSLPDDSNGKAPNHSYNSVKSMIEELGGKICSTVHKKVNFIISSDAAIKNATQKIRKALKFEIPVLKIEYIEYCYKNKRVPTDMITYVYHNIADAVQEHKRFRDNVATSPFHVEKVARKRKNRFRDKSIDDDVAVAPYKPPRLIAEDVTFECGCICHDRGENRCEWCIGSHSN